MAVEQAPLCEKRQLCVAHPQLLSFELAGLDVIPQAIFRALPDMALFLVTFIIIFLGFSMCFFIIYSADVTNFASIR